MRQNGIGTTSVPIELTGRRTHSGLGIASFIIAASTVFFLILILVGAAVLESSSPGGLDEESPAVILIGLLVFAVILANLTGLALGIAGCCQKQRKKVFSILGTVINGVLLVGFSMMLFS